MSTTDPVCGMEVDPSTAMVNAEFEGQTYYFCSDHCRVRFLEEPERYVRQANQAQAGAHSDQEPKG